MKRLEVSGAVRPICGSLGVKGINNQFSLQTRFPCEARSRLSSQSVLAFHFGGLEILLGCYTAWIGGQLPTFLGNKSAPFSSAKRSEKFR
jgi:hypothetical protein